MLNQIQEFENKYNGEVLEIVGVVDDYGVTAGWSRGDFYHTATLKLLAWKQDFDNVVNNEIMVRWLIKEGEIKDIQEKLRPHSILKLRVKKGRSGFALIEILKYSYEDAQLKEALGEYLKPVYYNHEKLGILILDKNLQCFNGEAKWENENCKISISVEDEPMEKGLETIYKLIDPLNQMKKKIKEFASKELLDLANDWLDDNENKEVDEITQEYFIGKISLDTVSISANGNFSIYFYDGDMFWGHCIIVHGNINGELNYAEMAG